MPDRERHQPRRVAEASSTPSGRLSIGALSRATGVPIETLRTWERRYGYPVPVRKASGHRAYPVDCVPRLQRIAEALARGHRAGDVVAASDDALQALLRASSAVERPPRGALLAPDGDELRALLAAVETFDADRLTAQLLADWARLGPLGFVQARVAPLVRAVGDAWAEGALAVRHEHFVAERLGDLLRSLRLPLEHRVHGPVVVLATLPGEQHGLGLQMAALVLVAAGCRVLHLGTETPVADIGRVARDRGVRAVGIGVSLSSADARTARLLHQLRALLPRRTILLHGGAGDLPSSPGITRMPDLATLDLWARRLTSTSPP
jgi:DNA-binding transcriptional MerR regulator/methylmalonyl-CoA mutase cobalamin-binding subunit